MGNTLITVALLAGLALAGSCNSSRPDSQAAVNQHMIKKPQLHADSITPLEVDGDTLPPVPPLDDEAFSPTTIIIHYDAQVGTASLDKAIGDYGAEVIYRYNNISAVAIRIPDGKTINEALDHFSQVEGVIAVNRDRKMRLLR